MAAFELFLSHARRHCSSFPSYHFSSLIRRSSSHLQPSSPQDLKLSTFLSSTSRSSFLGFHRFLSSSPETPDPSTIKPVSYTPKPKSEETNTEEEEVQRPPRELRGTRPPPPEEALNADAQPLTLEDIRYLKDASPSAYSSRVDRFSGGPPSISPVSYPTRAAPLPEDKNEESEELGEDKKRMEFEMERRRMQTELRPSVIFRKEEEKVLPFPTLIKKEKKKQKVVLDLQDAIKEVKANAKAGFDETVEAHVNIGVDPRRGDQMVRGATTLPHGTGKTIRIAVFAEGSAAEEARAAGADIVGGEELIEEIRKGGGKLNFDKCIATPVFMPRLGKIARILGPRGLMPNPKLGSVTSDVSGAVRDAKRGRIDFKIDKTAIVHVGLGKVSFTEASLRENVGAFVNALLLAKPVGLKKTSKYAGYVNSFSLCSTMGPGFPVSIQSLSLAADHYNKLQLK